MTVINCMCCGATEGELIHSRLTSVYSKDKWSVVKCKSCGNIVTLPVPDRKILNDIYSNTYLYPVHHLILGEKRMRARDLAKYIRKILPEKGKKIFEAGCMYGYLIGELKSDYVVKGIEIGEESVKVCKSNGLDVLDISLENYLADYDEKFDVIVLSHVFEHLLSCDTILEQLASRLNSSGIIILCIPNSDSVTRKIFGRFWGWWQVPVHINHFSELPLRVLAERKQLKVDYLRRKGGDSLMLLLNLINIFRFHNQSKPPGTLQKFIIRIFSAVFRYWYYVGNEELTVVMKRK